MRSEKEIRERIDWYNKQRETLGPASGVSTMLTSRVAALEWALEEPAAELLSPIELRELREIMRERKESSLERERQGRLYEGGGWGADLPTGKYPLPDTTAQGNLSTSVKGE